MVIIVKRVQVLVSTYNGQEYLREQLDSILAQDCGEKGIASLSVLVRDDGSTDGTAEILREYAGRYPGQFDWIAGENCGVIQSFFTLIEQSDEEADYYAFSDQDDFWKPGKLSAGIRRLEEMEEDGRPHLYGCKPQLVDEQLQPLTSEIKRPPMRPSFSNALVENIIPGCTAVMNRVMRDLIRADIPDFTVMHDWWFYLVASCFGTVCYDETPYICYRQHSGNVVGWNVSRWREFRERVRRFRGNRRNISRQLTEFLRIYGGASGERLPEACRGDSEVEEKLRLARRLVEGRHSFRQRVRLVREGKVWRQRKTDHRIFVLILLSGSY